jgi:hypothetical protein
MILDPGCLLLDAGYWILVEDPVFKREDWIKGSTINNHQSTIKNGGGDFL